MLNQTTRVYVVDDDAQIRKVLRWLIEPLGMDVVAIPDAYQFLDIYDPETTGCAILDVRMPMMSGLELQSVLAQRNICLPIIFISGHADVPITVRALKAGAFDFLEKPFNSQALLDSVNRAVAWHRERRRENACLCATRARLSLLSERERQVMELALAGETNKRIAEQLGITVRTVEAHRARLMEKMHADSLVGLAHMLSSIEQPAYPPHPQ